MRRARRRTISGDARVLIHRNVEPGRAAYAASMPSSVPTPVCPACGELMALRYRAIRRHKTEVEVWWRCPASRIHAGAACYALVPPPAEIACAPTGEPDDVVWRYGSVTPSSIERELRDAEAAIEHCRRHAERHRAEAERRERIGHDSSAARRLLRTFQWLQGEHEAHRDRVLAELLRSKRASP